jgi:hypothetical protein
MKRSKLSMTQVAELEGYAMANELELEQIEAKRREDEAQRIVRLLHLTGPTLEPAAVPSPPAQTAPRTEQLSMFGPGPSADRHQTPWPTVRSRPRRGRKRHRAWDGVWPTRAQNRKASRRWL